MMQTLSIPTSSSLSSMGQIFLRGWSLVLCSSSPGAGSGKTDTLAHRVAYLIAAGTDPRRILLLTFSRRAAAEMTRRVERIVAERLGPGHPARRSGITWAGTFHGVGARLLRPYGSSIGLPPGFTILDREDAADLLDLARHDLGLSKQEARFPRKATCLAIYSQAVNAQTPLEAVLSKAFPWCAIPELSGHPALHSSGSGRRSSFRGPLSRPMTRQSLTFGSPRISLAGCGSSSANRSLPSQKIFLRGCPAGDFSKESRFEHHPK
jgi:hypothetical protein